MGPAGAVSAREASSPTVVPSDRPPLARGPVLSAMAVLAVLLTATSGGFGYHRDELYFRMLEPAWGYVDQPPLTPAIARLMAGISDELWVLRIPATVSAVLAVLVVALIAREVGGGRFAQGLAAWGFGFGAFPLSFGHVLFTASIDLVIWPLICLLVIRALLRDPRWWVAVGVVIGVSTTNKLLVGVLVLSLAVGILALGPRTPLRSWWFWLGVAAATVLALPALVFQVSNDWPQLEMGAALAEGNGTEVRILTLPFLLVLLGPVLVPVWVAGLVGLLRRPAWRSLRGFAPALVVIVVVTLVMGAQPYYPLGLLAAVYAMGCAVVAERVAQDRSRRSGTVTSVIINSAVCAVIALPILPLPWLGWTPIPAISSAVADQVGWPEYAAQVEVVIDGLTPEQRDHAVVITGNYGEAGALDRFGDADWPPIRSGHNHLGRTPPPDDARVVVFVGGQGEFLADLFASCTRAGGLDNGVGVDNEEQGEPMLVCEDPIGGWDAVWPRIRHLD